MRSIIFSVVAALAACTFAAPLAESATSPTSLSDDLSSYMTGFKNPSIQSSVGGQAICISGTIDIAASATNALINFQQPTNSSEVTELLLEIFQVNSTRRSQLAGGQSHVNGTYGTYSQLCFPKSTGTINATTIQFLIHGSGFDRTYWNVASGYSYVDYAAEQGYTTFLYDRLGTGLSDHPDPIETVQISLQIAIAHELVQLLRRGGIANQTFQHVVGVGHSFGSAQVSGLTAQYPDDFDAVVLTGFSPDNSGIPIAFASLDLKIASQAQPLRFSDLPSGYLTATSIEGIQFFFFREPQFDPALLYLADATKQGITVGEFLAIGASKVSANFTGPIDVVNGEYDLPNCAGNCLLPYNKPAAVKDAFYPAASNGSSWYIAPQTGHGLNFHYTATAAYEHIHDFIKKNGF